MNVMFMTVLIYRMLYLYVTPNSFYCTKDGRNLGFPGFGLTLGKFGNQIATSQIHTAELSIAATNVLDYFSSSDQQRLDTIFDWEKDFSLRPTKNLIKILRHTCRAIAFTTSSPHYLLVSVSAYVLIVCVIFHIHPTFCFVRNRFMQVNFKV